ncbi:hypothetical protein [Streptomyces spongiae]|uniref:Uncharacterized protein n=1 Tax=Streptomyces spongiae TaxID=565072 RepID=A0A5N8XFZ4_9ACTN|nr:hypothetical protein [Streptomyces spongiae]MPY58430.1 hypothetical protein [Streptomyces spongiae]
MRLDDPNAGRTTGDTDRATTSAEEFEMLLGIEAGYDPRPAEEDTDPDTPVVTGLSSWWNHRLCTVCGHSFRRGDRVRVDRASRTVTHLDPALHCAVPRERDSAAGSGDGDAETTAFSEGLLAAWPPPVPLLRIPPGDWRLPNPQTGLRAPVCLYCGHTFRAGEYVIVCPCRPDERACGAAVHRDPAAGLSCWERWRPDGTVTVCPVTLARVRDRRT